MLELILVCLSYIKVKCIQEEHKASSEDNKALTIYFYFILFDKKN